MLVLPRPFGPFPRVATVVLRKPHVTVLRKLIPLLDQRALLGTSSALTRMSCKGCSVTMDWVSDEIALRRSCSSYVRDTSSRFVT
jgi:hypothetical protein